MTKSLPIPCVFLWPCYLPIAFSWVYADKSGPCHYYIRIYGIDKGALQENRGSLISRVGCCIRNDYNCPLNWRNCLIYLRCTYSIVQDIPWKADSHTAYQTTACFLHGTRRFITVFTETRHRTLCWASWIQFTPSIPISLRSILMLSSHLRLGLPSGLSPSGLPTKTL